MRRGQAVKAQAETEQHLSLPSNRSVSSLRPAQRGPRVEARRAEPLRHGQLPERQGRAEFRLEDQKVADGGMPQLGTSLAPPSTRMRAARTGPPEPTHEKIRATSPICCSSSAMGTILASGTSEAVCGRVTMTAQPNAANLLLQTCKGATIGMLPWPKWRRHVHQQSPVVQQMMICVYAPNTSPTCSRIQVGEIPLAG